MKWMKRLVLFNWQYFEKADFSVGNLTQITGPKGVGKSSIVDALQTLIVADQRKIKYNIAARGESTDRSLIKYIRGDIKNASVLRNGDVTSYIVAEFWDDKKSESFIVGFVADLSRDDSVKEEYFILSPIKITDLDFYATTGALLTGDDFRRYCDRFHLKQRTFERNKSRYQDHFRARMGHLPKRFFRTYTKAMAFQTIKDIREFVYSYILDPKELNIDLMKRNFETYENFRKQLNNLQERKNLLGDIIVSFERFSRLCNRIYIQEYTIRRLEYEKAKETSGRHLDEVKMARERIIFLETQLNLKETESTEAMDKWEGLAKTLAVNELKNKRDTLKDSIYEKQTEIEVSKRKLQALKEQVIKEVDFTAALFEWSGNKDFRWTDAELELLLKAHDILEFISSCEDYTDEQANALREVGSGLSEIQTRISMKMGTLSNNLSHLNEQKFILEEEIEGLKHKKLTYPPAVNALKKLLEERLGNRSQVSVLCEEMDILDEHWRNAIEGFLNTQKFDLLVEPVCFSEALKLYENHKRKYHIEGAGLIDSEKEMLKTKNNSREPWPNSLATLLVTSNKYVQARINHLLGKVIMAKDEQDLRNHSVAVTQTCMTYNRFVARQMKEKSYELPFIGKEALKRQLTIKENQLVQINLEIKEADQYLCELKSWNKNLSQKETAYSILADQLYLPGKIKIDEARLQELTEEFKKLDLSEVEKMEEELNHRKLAYMNLQNKVNELISQIAVATNNLESLNNKTLSLQENLLLTEDYWRRWEAEYPDLLERARMRWAEVVIDPSSIESSITNYRKSVSSNITQRDSEYNKLTNLRTQYNTQYGFKGNTTAATNEEYQDVYNSINMDIPTYCAKVEDALKQSEEQFRTHFIYGLQEAIIAANREFTELEFALKKFPFNEDRYFLKAEPSSKYRPYYDAIMHTQSTSNTGLLFGESNDEHSSNLKKLFEILINGLPQEQEEFKDYRRYLDFELKYESRGETFSYSKSASVESGGENESPFYITVLASFYHMYNSEAHLRLIVFDEAFDKIDTESTEACLKLVKKLNLQMIVVVPNNKTQHILEHVDTTWVVNRQGNRSFFDYLYKEELDDNKPTEPEQIYQKAIGFID